MDWMELVEAAEDRLQASRGSTSRCWRRRHLRAARRLVDDAFKALELADVELAVRQELSRSSWSGQVGAGS